MAKIKVRYLGAFADKARKRQETLEFDCRRLGELVESLLGRNGDTFRAVMIDPSTGALRSGTALLVNGHRRDLDYALADGDEVTLLTPLAGG